MLLLLNARQTKKNKIEKRFDLQTFQYSSKIPLLKGVGFSMEHPRQQAHLGSVS
jgi:hypothetical protein